MNRRILLASSALVLPALAGCAAVEKMTGTTNPDAAVQSIFNSCQYILPLVDALALGISVAVPGAAVAMGAVMTGIAKAGPIFQTFEATMTAVQAQPIVSQIENYAAAGVNTIANVVNGTPALSAYATRVQQAQAVVGLLTTFVNGATAMPTAAMAPTVFPSLLHL
jgi:hypothetical protein